jgi:hypothetical protein
VTKPGAYAVEVTDPFLHALSEDGPDALLDLDNLHRLRAAIAKKDSDVQREAIRILRISTSGGLQ